MKYVLLIFILILAGCIYQIPEATQLSSSDINSTADTFDKKIVESKGVQEFTLRTNYPPTYIQKSVEHLFEDCRGCLDYVSATASSIRKYDKSISYDFIVSVSGAVRLDQRDESIQRFFSERVDHYGFTPFYASSLFPSEKLLQLYNKKQVNVTALGGPGAEVYLKSVIFSGAVPVVTLDRAHLYNFLAKQYNDVANLPKQQSEEVFMSVLGFDKNIKITDHSRNASAFAYQDTPNQDFFDAWNSTANNYGPLFTVYFLKTHTELPKEKVLDIIKDDLLASHTQLTKDTAQQGYVTRKHLESYFSDNKEVAKLFKQSAEHFKNFEKEKIINVENKILLLL